MFKIKRIYQPYSQEDGYRVLVDRLWPRGVSKEKARIDLWLKDLAPSTELRKWFGHDPEKWAEFKKRYLAELDKNKNLINTLREAEKQHKTVTLLYAVRDEEHNEAVIIADALD